MNSYNCRMDSCNFKMDGYNYYMDSYNHHMDSSDYQMDSYNYKMDSYNSHMNGYNQITIWKVVIYHMDSLNKHHIFSLPISICILLLWLVTNCNITPAFWFNFFILIILSKYEYLEHEYFPILYKCKVFDASVSFLHNSWHICFYELWHVILNFQSIMYTRLWPKKNTTLSFG